MSAHRIPPRWPKWLVPGLIMTALALAVVIPLAWSGHLLPAPELLPCETQQGTVLGSAECARGNVAIRLDHRSRNIEVGVKAVAGILAFSAGLVTLSAHLLKRDEYHLEVARNEREKDENREAHALAARQQLLDRYNSAVNQLGHDRTDVRLGGLFTIEALINEFPEDYAFIGNGVLVAYIQEHARVERQAAEAFRWGTDLQAAWTILRRQRPTLDKHIGYPDEASRDRWATGPHLVGVDLDDCVFAGTDFTSATLTNCTFTNATLTNCTFTNATLTNCDFRDTRLTNCDFRDTRLMNCRFEGAALNQCQFEGAALTTCHFGDAALTRCRFEGAAITNCWFPVTTLVDCAFHDAALSQCWFSTAELIQCWFTNARLARCWFSETVFVDRRFFGAWFTDDCGWPAGFDPAAEEMIAVEPVVEAVTQPLPWGRRSA